MPASCENCLRLLESSLQVLPLDYCLEYPHPSAFPPTTQMLHTSLSQQHLIIAQLCGFLLSSHWTLVLEGNRVLEASYGLALYPGPLTHAVGLCLKYLCSHCLST